MAKDNDATDRRLLALMRINARESVATLARKLGLARTTVQQRITRLEQNGTISGYSVLLKRDPFGQYAEVIALMSVEHRHIKTVSARLRDFPEVSLCQMTSGEFEIVCRIRVAHLEDVRPVLEAIGDIDGVNSIRSIIVLSTVFDHSNSERTHSKNQVTALGRGELG